MTQVIDYMEARAGIEPTYTALQFVDVSSDSGTCVRFVVPNRVYLSPFLAAFGTGYSQRRAA